MAQHVVVIHRWRDKHALYAKYIDHIGNRVSYVTTDYGRHSVPKEAAAVVLVSATDDLDQLRTAADELTRRFGAPSYVIALNEGDLDAAADLRGELGCRGQRADELGRFRDKLVMLSTVAEAGIPVPSFADAPGLASVQQFANRHGWPVVIKPRRGTASRGVQVLHDSAEFMNVVQSDSDPLASEPHLVQSFVPEDIVHIDGLWTGSRLGPWRAARYISTCHDFTHGVALGSAELDDPILLESVKRFATAAASALSREPWVFHMEAFIRPTAGGGAELTFLEAGARVGGAEIPFLWREVHGIDLMSAAVDIQLDRSPVCLDPGLGVTAGWLLMPIPVSPPCRVLVAGLEPGAYSAQEQQPYASIIPSVDEVIPRAGGYEHVGGRFRFRGPSTQSVEDSIDRTIRAFRMNCESV
jgi:hypothetical protein